MLDVVCFYDLRTETNAFVPLKEHVDVFFKSSALVNEYMDMLQLNENI